METITNNFKQLNIGVLVQQKVGETNIEISRICSFLKCTEEEVENMYVSKSLDSEILLRWSKLLKYDFFRVYSQHLILYSPSKALYKVTENKKTAMPQFRKNIYTKEIIDFVLELTEKGEKTKQQIMDDYDIPKATFYTWIKKYKR
jgi:hypothetical protein